VVLVVWFGFWEPGVWRGYFAPDGRAGLVDRPADRGLATGVLGYGCAGGGVESLRAYPLSHRGNFAQRSGYLGRDVVGRIL